MFSSFDVPISPQSVRPKIPKQDDPDGTGFCQIQCDGGVVGKHWQPDILVGEEKDDSVDRQPDEVHKRELDELVMDRVFARFGKSPMAIPPKIADNCANDRNDVGVKFVHAEGQNQKIQHAEIDDR